MKKQPYENLGRLVYNYAFEVADSREAISGELAGKAAHAAEQAFLAVLRAELALKPDEFAQCLTERTLAPWQVLSETGPDAFTVRQDDSGLTITVWSHNGQRRAATIVGSVVDLPNDPHAAAEAMAFGALPVEALAI